MTRRKNRVENVNEEKENAKTPNDSHCENSSSKFNNESNVIQDLVVIDAEKCIDLSGDGRESKQRGASDIILSDVSNKNTKVNSRSGDTGIIADLTTNSQIIVGGKRRIDEISDPIPSDVEETEIIRLKKQCIDLEYRIEVLETKLRSDYFGTGQNIIHGILGSDDIFDNVTLNNNEHVTHAAYKLNMDPVILSTLIKGKATSTARSILKHFYPNPPVNYKLSDVSKALSDAIVALVKEVHPYDSSSTSKIRHAMSNYFASFRYKKRNKSMLSITNIENQQQ